MNLEINNIFISGTDGYNTYRIPSLLVTSAGTLLAFCEGRVNDSSDHGEIHLLVKRSEDGGRTWSPQAIVWEDGINTCGNPCAVQDNATGTIWLAMNWNRPGKTEDFFRSYEGRRVFMAASMDDGLTWTEPQEITAHVKLRNWGWHATGPGVGIVLKQLPHTGRLVVPCNHSDASGETVCFGSNVMYSDDHGRSWQLGGYTASVGLDECQIVELSDGRVMLNARTSDPNIPWRRISISNDGGGSWGEVQEDQRLSEPTKSVGCQGSLIRSLDGQLFFSNPAGVDRERLTVRMSIDDGATWPVSRCLHEGPSAYSCLASLPDGRIACLFERGSSHAYRWITYAAFDVEWLEDR